MKKDYTVEQVAESRWFYTFTEVNAKGEKIIIELIKCTNSGSSHSLPVLWKNHGYINRVLENYWSIETFVKDTENNCYGGYNPQHKLSEDGKRMIINFEWVFEATEENKNKLIDEVYRLVSLAQGETATEEKIRKAKEFAKERNIDIMTEIPKGWKKLIGAMTAPLGTQWIYNGETFKSGNKRCALLLV